MNKHEKSFTWNQVTTEITSEIFIHFVPIYPLPPTSYRQPLADSSDPHLSPMAKNSSCDSRTLEGNIVVRKLSASQTYIKYAHQIWLGRHFSNRVAEEVFLYVYACAVASRTIWPPVGQKIL
jgi:hypothetical protein